MNASNLQPTVVNLFVVSLKEVLTLDHADTNQIINTVSWLREPIFFVWVKKIPRGPDGFADVVFCGWVCLGWLSKQKGKGESKAGVQGGPKKRSYFHGVKWDEWGYVTPVTPMKISGHL